MSETESSGASAKTDPPADGGSARRWVIIVLLLLIIGASASHWGGDLWHHVQVLRLQRACLAFNPTAEQVVYSGDTDSVTRGEAADGKLKSSVPPVWVDYLNTVEIPTRLPPAPTTNPDRVGEAIVFLHELTPAHGPKRLVAVSYSPTFRVIGTTMILYHQFHPLVIEPAGWTSGPVKKSKGISQTFMAGTVEQPQMITAYAGQIDPKDASRFTMKIVVGEKELLIDGKLESDDSLIMSPRRFGATPASNRASHIGE